MTYEQSNNVASPKFLIIFIKVNGARKGLRRGVFGGWGGGGVRFVIRLQSVAISFAVFL